MYINIYIERESARAKVRRRQEIHKTEQIIGKYNNNNNNNNANNTRHLHDKADVCSKACKLGPTERGRTKGGGGTRREGEQEGQRARGGEL